MSNYTNTLTVRLGKTAIFAPPAGSAAEAWEDFRAEWPEVDGARVTVSGQFLNVQVERTMGSAGARVALVGRIAEALHSEPEVTPMTWGDGDGKVIWVLVTYQGQRICVETSICSCHPNAEVAS